MQNEQLTPRVCIRIGITLIGVWWFCSALKQFFVVLTFPRLSDAVAWSGIGDACVGAAMLFIARVMKAYEFPD